MIFIVETKQYPASSVCPVFKPSTPSTSPTRGIVLSFLKFLEGCSKTVVFAYSKTSGYFSIIVFESVKISLVDILLSWPFFVSPEAFINVAFLSPSSLALSFIIVTNLLSVSPTNSASATAASLPETIIRPSSKSLTLISSPAFKSKLDPSSELAVTDTLTLSSNLNLPSAIFSFTNKKVINFEILAIGSASSIFSAINKAPEFASPIKDAVVFFSIPKIA